MAGPRVKSPGAVMTAAGLTCYFGAYALSRGDIEPYSSALGVIDRGSRGQRPRLQSHAVHSTLRPPFAMESTISTRVGAGRGGFSHL